VAGHQLQVVECEHVRRVGHRHHQLAAVVEADRHRAQPAGRLGADQVEGADVRLEDGEVGVVEAEALRGRTRQLVARDRGRLEQHLLGGAAGGLALLDRLVDALAREEAHRHDHVGDEPRAARLGLRRREAVAGTLVGRRLRGRCRGRPARYGAERRPACLLGHRASATAWVRVSVST
jgi:hypothetical protein